MEHHEMFLSQYANKVDIDWRPELTESETPGVCFTIDVVS